MSFVCNDCGAHFDEPNMRTIIDIDSNAGFSSYRIVSQETTCPECNGTDYDESTTCAICGEDIRAVACEYGVCEECLKRLEQKASRILEANLETAEFDALRQWLDLPEVV